MTGASHHRIGTVQNHSPPLSHRIDNLPPIFSPSSSPASSFSSCSTRFSAIATLPYRAATAKAPKTYLIQVDNRLPELVVQLMEISHSHFSKVTRMILVEIRAVMVLTTCHTASTRMLAMLSDTAVACGNVPATVRGFEISPPYIEELGEVGSRKVDPVSGGQ